MSLLPHTGKAMLIDQVVDFDVTSGKQELTAEVMMKNHPHVFSGHFPAMPICPGHWLLEIGNLAAALLYVAIHGKLDRLIILFGCDEPRWRTQVAPEDTLAVTVTNPVIKRNKFLYCDILIINQNQEVVFTGKTIGAFGNEIPAFDF